MLEIASLTAKSHTNLHFLIAGEGELFITSKAQATAENLPITFLGWRSDIAELFAASDFAILTSDNEGIPLTLIQAAQAGLAIVAPNVGSISDIVLDGKSGTLTKPDSAEMAIAVGELVDSAALRAQYGEAGRIHADLNFSLAKSLADHGLLYDFSQHK